MNDNLKEWDWYEAGRRFNSKLDPPYKEMVDVNWEMFNGKQWINSGAYDDLPKPVFNIINRIISFFVASLTSNNVKVSFDTMTKMPHGDAEGPENDIEVLNSAWANFAERVKLQDLVREQYLNAAISGDMAFHFYFDYNKKPYDGKYSDVMGELMMEIKEGGEIFVGNPNDMDIQDQPHVIVSGRDTVKALQSEYDEIRGNEEFNITSDPTETEEIELEEVDSLGKATYIIVYTKKKSKQKKMMINEETGEEEETTEDTETVHVSKLVRNKYIYKDIDTGLKLYPVAFNNWEKQRGIYHGRALCTSIVPNQIFINRMFAMAMQNLMMTAFPKLIYDKNRVAGPSNRIGVSIGVDNMTPGDNISNLMTYLQPGNMSAQVTQLIDMAIEFTKDMLGANSALLGSVNPEQASGSAITIAARQSGVPLENPKNSMYELLEDCGRIFLDCVTNYYGERPVLVDTDEGKIVQMFDFEKLNDIYLSTKVDVGATTYWNEIAMIQTLDNLLQMDRITFEDYLERVPDDYITDKTGLLNKEKEKNMMAQQQMQPQEQPPTIEEIVASMSPEMQQQFASLGEAEQIALVEEYMQQ